jgi:hypothetical protein
MIDKAAPPLIKYKIRNSDRILELKIELGLHSRQSCKLVSEVVKLRPTHFPAIYNLNFFNVGWISTKQYKKPTIKNHLWNDGSIKYFIKIEISLGFKLKPQFAIS